MFDGRSLDDAERMIQDWQAGIEAQAAQARELSSRLAALAVTVRSGDEFVEVTVGSSGDVIRLELAEGIRGQCGTGRGSAAPAGRNAAPAGGSAAQAGRNAAQAGRAVRLIPDVWEIVCAGSRAARRFARLSVRGVLIAGWTGLRRPLVGCVNALIGGDRIWPWLLDSANKQ